MDVPSEIHADLGVVETRSSSGLSLRGRIAPRVRRMTSELSVFNPSAPKSRQVRRVFLWCTLFSFGLFTSLLFIVAIKLNSGSQPVDPTELTDSQLLEEMGSSSLSRELRVKALDEIGKRRISELKNTPMLFDGPEISIAFAKAAAQIGELALVPALMKQLDDPEPMVRSASAQALGVLGDRRTSEFLALRAAKENDRMVREKMHAAIGALGGQPLPHK